LEPLLEPWQIASPAPSTNQPKVSDLAARGFARCEAEWLLMAFPIAWEDNAVGPALRGGRPAWPFLSRTCARG
jgi:hypothetical protein